MSAPSRPVIVLDPYPRAIDLIFDAATKARLESFGEVIWHDGPRLGDPEIEERLARAEILIGQSRLDRARLDAAPRLRAVFNVEGNFLPNIDYAECHRRGIAVLATAPVFAHPVAEMALGLALSAARRMHEADAAIRAGRESLYGEGDNGDSWLLHRRTLALVGCGNVGRALLPLLKAFGGDILVHDPWIQSEIIRDLGATPVSLEACFERASVVFILSATTVDNAGRIGRAEFERMGRGSIVVLVSRAGVVNFDDLLDAAASGRIRAAIDVWPEEPIPAGHRARSTPNTILQAHRAGNIPEIWPMMGSMVADDVDFILRGLPPQRCQRAQVETVARMRSRPVG